jgi:hypothetical protein
VPQQQQQQPPWHQQGFQPQQQQQQQQSSEAQLKAQYGDRIKIKLRSATQGYVHCVSGIIHEL